MQFLSDKSSARRLILSALLYGPLLTSLEPPRQLVSCELGAGEARTDGPEPGAVEAAAAALCTHLKQLAPSLVSSLLDYIIRACGWCVGAACLCLVCTTVCALCVSHPLGVPGRAADGASRGRGSKRATLAASLAHASLTVPSD